MGLDNGIIRSYGDKEDEFAYWRKCWDLRNDMLRCFENVEQNDCEYDINETNIDKVKNVIHHYYYTFEGLMSWSEDGMYYWDAPEQWHEIKTKFGYILWRLHYMILRHKDGKKIMKKLKDFEKYDMGKQCVRLYFYDSY